jgi:four helix bundle protein
MAVRDLQDLLAWQLSYELKCEVFAFTATGPASMDFKYRDQILTSSASAPSNIAEGFGRMHPRDAARFYEFARGSLMETLSHLIDGRDRGYLETALCSRLSNRGASGAKNHDSIVACETKTGGQSKLTAGAVTLFDPTRPLSDPAPSLARSIRPFA